MKYFFLSLLLFTTLLTGCDTVAPGDRLIEIPLATVRRNVLIEEFTGQRCLNCPEATAVIKTLQNNYSADRLIAVAIHAGPLSVNSSAGVVGLRTPLGDTYYKKWAVPSVPKALVNRKDGLLEREQWAARIYQEFEQATNIEILLTCQYRAHDRFLETKIKLDNLAENVQARLQLWLVEDKITAVQQFPDNKIDRDYQHYHVLRAAINGDWGTEISLQKAIPETQTFNYTLPVDIVAENAYIVAFVYNDSGVLQVVRKKVTTE